MSLIAVSAGVPMALEAADLLREEHETSAEVIDLQTISPLDTDTLNASVARTGRALVVDESPPRCSLASEIAAVLTESNFGRLKSPVARVCAAASPVPFSPPLEDAYLPSVEKIVAAVLEM